MYRGSRKHVLDWTDRPSFPDDLKKLLASVPITIASDSIFMPRGYEAPSEARLERFGSLWLPESSVWSVLEAWWLRHLAGANTPNWDIVVGCLLEERPGLVLVEAKANWPELSTAGKPLNPEASCNSRNNHKRIGEAIEEACMGWRTLNTHVAITRDSHYQLSNRLAFTWKLAMLGLPVVLLYLGFTGDEGIRDAGAPFSDDEDWQRAFRRYAHPVVPHELLERRLDIGPSPVWLMSRSRRVIEVSPREASK